MTLYSMLVPLPHKLGMLLDKYFERVSLGYHIFFICFLAYLLFFRKKGTVINRTFIRSLGLYVLCYGFVIFVWGPDIINRNIWGSLY